MLLLVLSWNSSDFANASKLAGDNSSSEVAIFMAVSGDREPIGGKAEKDYYNQKASKTVVQ